MVQRLWSIDDVIGVAHSNIRSRCINKLVSSKIPTKSFMLFDARDIKKQGNFHTENFSTLRVSTFGFHNYPQYGLFGMQYLTSRFDLIIIKYPVKTPCAYYLLFQLILSIDHSCLQSNPLYIRSTISLILYWHIFKMFQCCIKRLPLYLTLISLIFALRIFICFNFLATTLTYTILLLASTDLHKSRKT